MQINPQDKLFADIGSYDPECCEVCAQAQAIITRWRDKINRTQAASAFGAMPIEKMTLNLKLVCTPVPEEGRLAVQVLTEIERPDGAKEGISPRKGECINNALNSLSDLAARVWSLAYLCNDAVAEVDQFLAELNMDDEDAEQPARLN